MIFWLMACSGTPADTGVCGREPPLDYPGFGQGWMAKHCVGCHSSLLLPEERNGAPVGVDLDTRDDVVRLAERIRVRTLQDRDMPPGGGPSDEERALLVEWLECDVEAR